MNLQEMFSVMRPFLLGTASHEATVTALYGHAHAGVDARRLGAYAHNYVHNVQRFAELTFPTVKDIVVARHGVAAWGRATVELGRTHPMPELRWGVASLPAFLEERAHELGLEPWLAEVADLDLWERRVQLAEDVEDDASSAPRLAAPLELRDYAYDVLGYAEAKDWSVEPKAARSVVALWRVHGRLRKVKLGRTALALLRAVAAGRPVSSVPAARDDVERVWAQLVERELVALPAAHQRA